MSLENSIEYKEYYGKNVALMLDPKYYNTGSFFPEDYDSVKLEGKVLGEQNGLLRFSKVVISYISKVGTFKREFVAAEINRECILDISELEE